MTLLTEVIDGDHDAPLVGEMVVTREDTRGAEYPPVASEPIARVGGEVGFIYCAWSVRGWEVEVESEQRYEEPHRLTYCLWSVRRERWEQLDVIARLDGEVSPA